MATDLIIPEIQLLDKLEEMDNMLSHQTWEDLRDEAKQQNALTEYKERTLPPVLRAKRKMVIQDFVEKAIEKPITIKPEVNEETLAQLHRLHIYCCQRVINLKEIRQNPLMLPFQAIMEMKLALVAIMISYRLTTPSAPYKWSRDFFEKNIIADKDQNGGTVLKFVGVDGTSLNNAIHQDIITDWMVYRTYDGDGIRTLMDTKNNLIRLPEYTRGGHPAAEFSRFQRKWAEHINRKEQKRNETLDLEFRKTLITKVAEQTANELLESGLSSEELLQKLYTSKDLTSLIGSKNTKDNRKTTIEDNSNKCLEKNNDFVRPQRLNRTQKQIQNISADISNADELIAEFLDEDDD